METPDTKAAGYERPQLFVAGTLRELTRQNATGNQTDVPFGTPVPPFSIFS